MAQFLSIIQLISAVLLIVFVLIQQRGAGLGGIFGGEGGVYRTKRGAEKVLFITTIVLAVVFVASSFLHVLLAK
ncbi:MAG: preprotein translocase subunit SecG [Candidatus Komeilibacteria bacterium CG10_big_fil_rev_8_21_14_0_10_41_13]|uniref:Protein-export membrane protein SecG n=1 Tax=Candidatus Komeilibacteria bacterium CG10_big_fil_rev_8_21_14_0_10_41_13 TaxID=1974476 RepID=A0A2M6WD00_9BACT|nr:MAG: preprotein translocase subunit SecG [Candidatus Komeilibacteria bacterium CG10_big_fil_rev_8_21_14_0_10_41_13]